MIIKPRVKDYLCLTAHPEGCKKNVEDQIAYVKAQGEIPGDAKKVLVIGCSTGYGLDPDQHQIAFLSQRKHLT